MGLIEQDEIVRPNNETNPHRAPSDPGSIFANIRSSRALALSRIVELTVAIGGTLLNCLV